LVVGEGFLSLSCRNAILCQWITPDVLLASYSATLVAVFLETDFAKHSTARRS